MPELALTANTRTVVGRHVHALRRTGSVPAVLYGHNLEPLAIQANVKDIERIWRRAGRTHLIDLTVDGGGARKVLIRAFDIDPRTGNPLHADFFAVNLREKLTADVPIVVVGESPAVLAELGQLQQVVTHIRIECLPSDLPAQLSVDVSGLAEVEAGISLGDVPLPEGVVLVHADPTELVVKVVQVRISEEDEAPAEDEAVATDAEGEGEGDGGGATPTEGSTEER